MSKLGTWKENYVSGDTSMAKVVHIDQPSGLREYDNPTQEYIAHRSIVDVSANGKRIGEFTVDPDANVAYAPDHGKKKPVSDEIAAQVKSFIASNDPKQLDTLASIAQSMQSGAHGYEAQSTVGSILSTIRSWIR